MTRRFPGLRHLLPSVLRRRLPTLLTVVAVVAAIAVVPASPAAAGFFVWTMSDGFENNPSATWSFESSAYCLYCGHFISNSPWGANSGSGYAEIESKAPGSFYSVERNVHLVLQSPYAMCDTQISTRLGAGQLNFEVIDPRTWTYIGLTSELPPPDDGLYRRLSIGPWSPRTSDVVIRVSVLRSATLPYEAFSNVDDLQVTCE